MDRDEDQSGLSGRMRYLLSLLFIWWAFLIPFICQLLHPPLFLLAQAFNSCGQSLRVCGQICWCPRCSILLLGCQFGHSICILNTNCVSQMIYLVVFVPSMWLWDFGRTCHGLDGFDRARWLVGVVDPCQCFLLAVAPVSLMCKTNTGMQTFLRSSGRAWLSSLAFATISFTVAARILALASLLLASL